MFKQKSNSAFNNDLFNNQKIIDMHETMKRLYLAAKDIHAIDGQSAVARKMNLSPQRLNNWEARGMSKNGMLIAEQTVGCSALWLETGVGNMRASTSLSPLSNTQEASNKAEFDVNIKHAAFGMRPIPVISYIQAGRLSEISDPYAPGDGFATEICDDDLGPASFALEIEGESMLPDFRPGDRIVIDPNVVPNPGDFVVAKNGKQEATFKKYRPRGANDRGQQVFELVPLNEDYPTLRSDIETLHIIGTMVEHRKKFRRK